jgi:hypothetical protein
MKSNTEAIADTAASLPYIEDPEARKGHADD